MAKPPIRKPNIDKQKAFIREYVRLGGKGHGSEAYRNTYGKTRKYTNKTCNSESSKLLRNPNLKPYLEELLAKAKAKAKEDEEKTVCDAAEIIRFYSHVVRNEEKDQFGLDLPISERIKAAKELYNIVGTDNSSSDAVTIIDDIGGADDADKTK